MAGIVWCILLLFDLHAYYAQTGDRFSQVLFSSLSVVIITSYFASLQKARRRIEELFPYHPPYNLLALRVFGNSQLDSFLRAWQHFGTLNRLDGPDTVKWSWRYYKDFLKRDIEKAIVEDKQELAEEFQRFHERPDKDGLRFSVNAIQCTDKTWKEALQRMIDDADVILLDLSNLTQQRLGVSYELKKLIEEVPLKKVLLLLDDSTDTDALDKLLQDIIRNIPSSSPNRSFDFSRIQLFHTHGMDSERFAGLVLDRALTLKTLQPPDPIKAAPDIHWTAFRFSYRGRKIWNSLMVLLAATIIVLCIFY